MLDIAQNSFTAQATLVGLALIEEGDVLHFQVTDNGRGMSPDFLRSVTDPFTTTRTTRKVGMGLPLLQMAAQLTGGDLSVESTLGMGTQLEAIFHLGHIDCPPVGDMAATLALLIQGLPPGVALTYTHGTPKGTFRLDTRELQELLGDVPLNEPEIILWIQDYVAEGEQEITL